MISARVSDHSYREPGLLVTFSIAFGIVSIVYKTIYSFSKTAKPALQPNSRLLPFLTHNVFSKQCSHSSLVNYGC